MTGSLMLVPGKLFIFYLFKTKNKQNHKKEPMLRWHMGKCAENTASKLKIGRWG